MTEFEFPKYGESQRIGKRGEAYFDDFVHRHLGFVYRTVHQESDFGIDGHIDIIENNQITGRSLAVQIKCGDSYYAKTTNGGIKYVGENKHLNYFLNCEQPIILIVLNGACNQGKWIQFKPNITTPVKNGWWMEIPSANVLSEDVASEWAAIAGPAIDYTEAVKLSWEANEVIDTSNFSAYHMDKDDVENLDFSGIKDVIDRMSRNKSVLLNNRGTLEIFIAGYDEDSRELYEIPEVRRWYAESLSQGIPWFYFLGDQANGMGLTVLLFSCCKINIKYEKNGKKYVEIPNYSDIQNWLDSNFINLNNFTDEKLLSEEINREMSEKAIELVRRKFVNIG